MHSTNMDFMEQGYAESQEVMKFATNKGGD